MAKRNNAAPAAKSGKAVKVMVNGAECIKAFRSGHGAITRLVKEVAAGNYNPEQLFKDFAADAKEYDEPMNKSRAVMSFRAVWSRLVTDRGLSFKDDKVTVGAKDASKGKGGRPAKVQGGQQAPAKTGKAGKSADAGEPVPVTTGDFETTLGHLVALMSAMGPTQLNEARTKVVKGLQAVGMSITYT